MYKLGLEKGKGTRDQIANIHWIIEKAREFQKISASLTALKPLTIWITTNWKILKEMGIPDHLACLLRNLSAGQETEKLEMDMEQQTGSKLRKEYLKAVYYLCAYLTYMQSTSGKMPDWVNHKLESKFLEEITTSDIQMIAL